VRVYLPPDANCLLSVFDHCLRSRHYVNVVVAGKHALPQWLTMEAAAVHCTEGIGIWQWASNDQDSEPDGRHGLLRGYAHAGDSGGRLNPEAASSRAENQGDQCRRSDEAAVVQRASAWTDETDYDSLFTKTSTSSSASMDIPRGASPDHTAGPIPNLHVRGYKEEGTSRLPSTMRVRMTWTAFISCKTWWIGLPQPGRKGAYLKQMAGQAIEHKHYIR